MLRSAWSTCVLSLVKSSDTGIVRPPRCVKTPRRAWYDRSTKCVGSHSSHAYSWTLTSGLVDRPLPMPTANAGDGDFRRDRSTDSLHHLLTVWPPGGSTRPPR